VFLDSNVWNQLVEPNGLLPRQVLVSAERDGRFEFVGTPELLEEIAGTAYRKPEKFTSLMHECDEHLGTRILKPLNLRYVEELVTGGVLPENSRYMSKSEISDLRQKLKSDEFVSALNDKVYERKLDWLIRDCDAKIEVLAEVDRLGEKPRDFVGEVSVKTIRDYVRAVVAAGPAVGLSFVADEDLTYQRLPSAWLVAATYSAQITRAARDGRAMKDSDLHDRLHASAGAYYDVLVTEDRQFREALRIVPDVPFEVLTSGEFVKRLS
jgi:hypothetical protein